MANGVEQIDDMLNRLSIDEEGRQDFDEIQEIEIEIETEIKKDPTLIARGYQLDLCRKAFSENTIAYLGTGCGKTHIAVLLIHKMRHLIKKPQKDICVCVFLAPTVALVEQQAKVIKDSINVKVGVYCGSSKKLKDHASWGKELAQHEVLVMTPQILLQSLSHCFIRIEWIVLLIFDECHYAQAVSNHPYAEIMKVFYHGNATKLPRIFGMTASPIFGKGASVSGLESLLRAKVYSVEDKGELERFVTSPKVGVYYYATAAENTTLLPYCRQLEEIKSKCALTLVENISDTDSRISTKKILQKLHLNLCFCIENLGVWGALQAAHILLKGDCVVRNELMEMEGQSSHASICDTYLSRAATMFASDRFPAYRAKRKSNSLEVLQEPFFSKKLLQLIDILSNFRLQPNMKCIIFVNRILTARSLSSILQSLQVLSAWKCDFLVGVHSGLKSVSRKSTNAMLDKFCSGELNLLVATKVAEEGLDIQTCCLVVRFDLPETVASFIQSRGRARMPQSEYAFLVDSGSEKELNLIDSFTRAEEEMNDEIEFRTSDVAVPDIEEKTYRVQSTGATISSGSSIPLLYRYCSKLPHDEFFKPKPEFWYFDEADGTVCQIILPSNAPTHQVLGAPQSSKDAAKRDACLEACKLLHQLGALTNYLLPEKDDNEDLESLSDSDCSDDEDTRRELHEMLVPAVLREPWSKAENHVHLSSYFVKFRPHPLDRDYKQFGLFLKVALPGEAERMKLDLHLARGRSVVTELVPSSTMLFTRDEITLAEKFQEMFLKVILDRSEFISEYVPLGRIDFDMLVPRTYYLMLPVIWHECEEAMMVDWKLVKRCLSSPIFRMQVVAESNVLPQPNKQLHLANGPKRVHDVQNSLIYVPSKKLFYFVSDVVLEKNAYSEYKASRSHVQHYYEKFGVQLSHPNQPLLKAKQLFCLDNLLRKKGNLESREKEEHFVELPPEICVLKIVGFSKDIGSSLSLLPSVMHRLESLLVALELKHVFSVSFPEGAEVSASRVLEALTTENCNEHFSLERLEVLGDAFLKFAVGRRLFLLHDAIDEGQLTRKRSNVVNNSNLLKLATASRLQVYIRDQSFDPCQFFALGRPCLVVCSVEMEKSIHLSHSDKVTTSTDTDLRCTKSHHWLHKKTIADVVEALVGAFIVDSGFKGATSFLKWVGIQVEFEDSEVSRICSASSVYLPLAAQIDIAALEGSIGYQFNNKGLLLQAFVHPSYSYHSGGCYQRLEFLGDAVLDYLMTSYLYSVYPKLKPGQLTDLRSTCVNNICFANIAIHRSFYKFIFSESSGLCKSMDKYIKFSRTPQLNRNVVEPPACPKALGDLVESCIGAVLLDTGFNLNHVWKIMLSFLDPVINFSGLQLSPIRELQELCQSHNLELEFASSKKDKTYTVEAKVNAKDVSEYSSASNFSKKAAKRNAAKQLILTLKEHGYKPKSKSLEEILKLTHKTEAKLIGYNETPTDVIIPSATELDNLKVQDSHKSGASSSKVHPLGVQLHTSGGNKIKLIKEISSLPDPLECQTIVEEDNSCSRKSQTTGGSCKKSAKSRLYEICTANCWNPPVFICCKEEGASHLREFTYRVIVKPDCLPKTIVEATGRPATKKKVAAEHAAEGAIWILKKEFL